MLPCLLILMVIITFYDFLHLHDYFYEASIEYINEPNQYKVGVVI